MLVKERDLHKPSLLVETSNAIIQHISHFVFVFTLFHLLWNTVGHNELITRPAWLRMVAASPRIKAANPQMQAHSNATERSFWHIRAKLILVWTYLGCCEVLQQQACLWRSASLCWVRSKSKSEIANQQPMKLRLASNFIRSSSPSHFTVFTVVVVWQLCT